MNIFFAASIRGGREQQPLYDAVVSELKKYGEVHAPHTADATLTNFGETELPDSEIHERELAALTHADIVVAEVTVPSLGVGYLVARASEMGKRVVVLYHGENLLELSSMIKGDQRVTVRRYTTAAEIPSLVSAFFSTNVQE